MEGQDEAVNANEDGTIGGEYPVADAAPPPRKRLTSDMVAKARDFETEDVDVPQWGGFITIKALSAKERDAFENSLMEKKGKSGKREYNGTNVRARLVVLTAIDEQQNRIWGDDAANWLGNKNAAALNTLYAVAARLCGITEADEEEWAGKQKAGSSGRS